MLQNNLDPDVAERPEELVVYGGIGRAARDWACFDKILDCLRVLEDDESLLIQSGKPVGVFKTHTDAPRVLLANSNLVPKWATWEHFHELDAQGLFMYGQMTAGSWIYIGTQGIVQGTYETFAEAARQHHGGSLAGKWILTAGLGGMGGAQPLAATFAGAVSLNIECQQASIDFRLRTRYVDEQATDLDDALARVAKYTAEKKAVSIALLGNAARIVPALAEHFKNGGPNRPGACDRSDLRARPDPRLPAGRLVGRADGRAAQADSITPRRAEGSGREKLRRSREGNAAVPGDGRADGRLRQQHPPGRVRRRRQRTRSISPASSPRTSARCSARARARSAGSPCRATRKTSARPTRRSRSCSRTTPTCTAGSTWPPSASRSRACRLASAGSRWASATSPASRSTRWCAPAS